MEGSGYPLPLSDDLTLNGLIAIVRRRRFSLIFCLVLVVGLVGAYTVLSQRVYEATSVVRFEEEHVDLPQLVQQLSTQNRIGTEMEVLQYRSAAVTVIDSLGLRASLSAPRHAQVSDFFSLLRVAPGGDTLTLGVRFLAGNRVSIWRAESPQNVASAGIGDTVRFAGVTAVVRSGELPATELEVHVASLEETVRSFAASLKVSRPVKDADLLAVRVRGSDPVRVAAAANLVAEQIIATRRHVQLARTGSTVAFLRHQLDTLGTQLRIAEDGLRAYRERAGVVNAQEQARTQVERLTNVQGDRGTVEAERQALAMLLKQMRSDSSRAVVGGDASRRLMSFPTLFRNQAASQLLGALAQVENERAALLMRRTPQDPDVQMLANRIRELEAQLGGIAETYLQGLTNQVVSLDAVARVFGGALDSLPGKEVLTGRLEREVLAQQNLYTLVQTRLKEAEITQAMEDPSVRIVDLAVAPNRPVQPMPLINLAASLVIGSMLGVGTALGRELTDRSVRSRTDVLQASGLPILGVIPRLRRRSRALPKPARSSSDLNDGAVVAETGLTHPALGQAAASIRSLLVTLPQVGAGYVESFNQLHANLALSYQQHPIKVVVITSPLPGEGKTISAINFALTLATRGLRVLLIDADLRRGLIGDVLDCRRGPGFAELLTGAARFEDAARRIEVGTTGSLMVVPSGTIQATPGGLLEIDRLREVLAEVVPQFDLVLIDSPPVNLLADAAILGSAADGVLLVVRAGHTKVEALRFAMDRLTAAQAPVIGALLNDIDPRRHGGDDGSYSYLTEVERYYQAGRGPS